MTLGYTKTIGIALFEGKLHVVRNEGEDIRAFIPNVRAVNP